jgi:hypothetical protein
MTCIEQETKGNLVQGLEFLVQGLEVLHGKWYVTGLQISLDFFSDFQVEKSDILKGLARYPLG